MDNRKPFREPFQFDVEDTDEFILAIPAGVHGPFRSYEHILSINDADGLKGRIDLDTKTGTIKNIEVRKQFRRQGVATRLVQSAQKLSEQFDVVSPTIEGAILTDRGRRFFRTMEGRGVLPTNIAKDLPRAGNNGRGSYD